MNPLEAAHGVFGAWRLLHFDRSGLSHFRATPEGFWNSFWVALIALPAEALMSLLVLSAVPETAPEASLGRVTLVFVFIFAVRWLAYLATIAELSEAILRGERFIKDPCPVAEFGLVGQTMHKIDENVSCADIETLTEIYLKVLETYFGLSQ